jgi:hypothetical protein
LGSCGEAPEKEKPRGAACFDVGVKKPPEGGHKASKTVEPSMLKFAPSHVLARINPMLLKLTRFILSMLRPKSPIAPEIAETEAFNEGRQAYLKHVWNPRATNPYVPGTKSHESWRLGFEDARRADIQTW